MKAVVFDMDGLMFDSERVVQYAWNQAGSLMVNKNLGEEIYHTLGFNKDKRRQYFKNLLGENFDFETFQIISSCFYYNYIHRNGIPMKEGLKELLQYLKDNHYRIALATSSSHKNAVKHLTDTNIIDYFDVLVTADQVKKAKPDPEIYLTACLKLGVNPKEAYALEDSYHGIQSAYFAGMKAVFIPDLLKDDYPIKDYIEVKCDSLLLFIDYLKKVNYGS